MAIRQVDRSTLYATDQRSWNTTLTATSTSPQERVGTHRRNSSGREYVYVQTRDALTIGQPVRQSVTATAAQNRIITNLAAGYAADYAGELAFDNYGTQLPTNATDALKGWRATLNFDATSFGDTYLITGNTTTTVKFDRGLDTLIADNDVWAIWSPWVVELAGGSATYASNQADPDGINDAVRGIALGTVAAASYCWVQTKGVCEVVLTRSKATGFSFNPYAYDSTTYFPPFAVAGGTAGTMEGVLMTGVQSGSAATNIELTQLAQGVRCQPVVPLVTQTAATQPAPFYLDFIGLGD